MTTATIPHPEASISRPLQWIAGPTLDLMVGCGAWSLGLLGLVFAFGARSDTGITLAFYSLSVVCNYPHYFATLYRAYRTRTEIAKYRLFTVHLTLLLLATAALVHWVPSWGPLFFTIAITWSPWHYTGQNFGIAMMFARRNGGAPSRAERNWLYAAFVASYLSIFLVLHSGVSDEPYVLSLGLSPSIARIGSAVAALVFFAGCLRGGRPLLKRMGWRASAPCLTVLVTQFLWFVFPSLLVGIAGAQLKRTSYSIGVLAFMHCAQYLWITQFYARREAIARGERWRPWLYAGTLVVGGLALFVPGPWMVSYAFHYDYAASFLIFSALVNIHHFVVDGAIWKLRDGTIAAYLLGGRDSSPRSDVVPWTSGWSRLARAGRFAVVVAIVLLAGVDQARFYMAADVGSLSRLQDAARLNPFDAPVKAAIARAQAQAGMTDAAIGTLREAIAIDPYDVSAQRMLAKLLVETGRVEDAYRHHAQMVKYVRPDVDTLVNYGSLAAQMGRDAEAVNALREALEIDDVQPLAHLRLAEELVRTGQAADAVAHFNRFVVLSSAESDARVDPKQLANVLIEAGDAYASLGRPEEAGNYYGRAAEFASRAGELSLEGGAYGRLARLLDSAGRVSSAADAYRRAISRDEAAHDVPAAAIEWFNYGQLLAAAGGPPRLVLACLLKAQQGLGDDDAARAKSVADTVAEMERQHPEDAAVARRNGAPLLDDARSFTFSPRPAHPAQ